MKAVYRLLGYLTSILIVLLACSKDSDSDFNWEYEEDPSSSGYMEAKVNGELKVWEGAVPFICHDCGCFNMVHSAVPNATEMVTIVFDMPEGYECGEFEASYSIGEGENLIYYGSKGICDDDDPLTPAYTCHDVSITINHVRGNLYSGTFSFTASRNCGEEVVLITDGKFEIESTSPMCDYF